MKQLLLFTFLLSSAAAFARYQYVSPMPGSTLNTPLTHIIIREGSVLDPASLDASRFTLTGSKSGGHSFRIAFSDDQKTILLYPDVPFGYAEEVTVNVMSGISALDGRLLDPYKFSFTTHRAYSAAEQENFKLLPQIVMEEEMKKNGVPPVPEQQDPAFNPNERALLGSFTIVKNINPSPGEIFYDAWNGNFGSTTYDGYNIITPDGDSVYASDKVSVCFDFSVNPNGYLSVFNDNANRFDVYDSNYVLIDSYYPGNGRSADPHEFTIYEDGHAFMIASETHIVDMSIYNPNYSHNANVTTNVIQEFDKNKNVIFEWRAWDHIAVTESNQNLAFSFIDAIHTNSIDLDADGNIVASNRHLSQVNKIDRNTGDFIWRLGGTMNQFTFINDPEHFSFEHDARCLSNGNLTLWDNGNGHLPTHSTAKEYQIDDVNMTATLVWSYNPKTYTNTNAYFYAMGSVRRLDNGNTLINGGWDNSSNQSNMWEVTPANEVVWELALNNSKSLVGYRAAKYIWKPCAPVLANKLKVKNITDHSAKVSWPDVSNAVSYDIQYRKLGTSNWKLKNNTDPKKILSNLKPATTYEYQVMVHCQNGYGSDWSPINTFTTLPLRIGQPDPVMLSVQVHPNPTSGQISFDVEATSDNTATISIFDISGKVVFSSVQDIAAGIQSLSFDLTTLPEGIYLARLNTMAESKTVKFVKE
ncbi:MAG: aryl-sulfate sulfotransferase [Chitinophagales bacterium]|nr:aryl-sulfate sulfotransferase [Chitinophagales bacterium]